MAQAEHPKSALRTGNIADELARAPGTLEVVVVSPARPVFRGDAKWVTVAAWDGQLGIWPKHTSIVAALTDVGMTPSTSHSSCPPSGESCETCVPGDDGSPANPGESMPWWRRHGLFALSGVLAAGAETLYFAGVKETSPVIVAMAVVSILLGGLPTLRKGWIALRTFTLNINVLMTVAIIGGAVIGAWPEIARRSTA